MALPYPIASTQTDAKSPVDDNLMDSIRLDLDYLDSLFATGAAIFTWNINGRLSRISAYRKSIDTIPLFGSFQPGFVRCNIRKSGLTGSFQFDIRKHTNPKSPITEIAHQYEGATTSIANIAPALATQSITRSTAQIATQSISVAKAAINISSIINVGGNFWRYNLASTPDADWVAAIANSGSVTFSGATSGGNNGTFAVVEVNQSGHPSVVISNASGVAQTTAAGTATLQLYSYNYANPVSTDFVSGEQATFASHTNVNNNGNKTIYKINQGGNNIWVFNATGATQASTPGTADVNRWKYGLLAAAPTPDFTVGEKLKAASHTTGANNGNFTIVALNSGGNNIVVYNPAGVVQGGVAGTCNTNRWIYSLPTDPSSQISSGQTVQLESHTTAANNFTPATVLQVNRSAVNNVVIYNEAGVAQAGSAGFVRHTRKLVKFATDQSSFYTASTSAVEITGCPNGLYNYRDNAAPIPVLEVNRGGGSNFNIVIDVSGGPSQASPAGYVMIESKSIFTSTPSMAVDVTSKESNQFQFQTFTNIVAGLIPAQTPLALYIVGVPAGPIEDISITLH